MDAVVASAARRGIAAAIGTSLIARAASRTSRGSASFREVRDRGILEPSQGQQDAHPHGRGGVSRRLLERVAVVQPGQPHDGRVPEVRIAVVVAPSNSSERHGGLGVAELAQRHRGEEPDTRVRVPEQSDELAERRPIPSVTRQPWPPGPGPRDRRRRAAARRPARGPRLGPGRRRRATWPRPQMAWIRASRSFPDEGDSLEDLPLAAAGQLELGLLPDPHVGMGQQRGRVHRSSASSCLPTAAS